MASMLLLSSTTYKITMLDKNEMVKTEGEFWGVLFRIAWAMAFGWASRTPAY